MRHVLIIEDEPMIAFGIEALLVREGATSFSLAMMQDEAVISARAHRPYVVCISATAAACCVESETSRALSKALDRPAVVSVFRELHALGRA